MKILLAGYEGSKKILPASSWLLNKYLLNKKEFDIYWLNYGDYDGKLFIGKYVKLDDRQIDGMGGWSRYLYNYISQLKDKYIIFGLDDFFISNYVNYETYLLLKGMLGGDTVAARLADITWYPPIQINCNDDGICSSKPNSDYLCTAQYTIWDRKKLLEILALDQSAWNFESIGSKYMKDHNYSFVAAYNNPFKYATTSALSGCSDIRLDGLLEYDKDKLKELCLI